MDLSTLDRPAPQGPRIATPWGDSQTFNRLADGIYSITTASHGGLWLDPEQTRVMKERDPDAFGACIGAGLEGLHGSSFWEEDCAWCFVARAFPEAFPDVRPENVAKTLEWIGERCA